jgi:thiamine-phosphate diphosphorylase
VSRFTLHLITDPHVPQLIPTVLAACGRGIDVVQVREKHAPALDVYRKVLALREPLRAMGCTLLVNDRADVAVAADVDGVHLAAKSLPVAAARRVVGARLIGRSVHGLDEALAAAAEGADYLTFGHVYPTQSKPGLPPRSLDELRRVVEQVSVPVIAIGGITVENVEPVLQTGVAGVAVISAILAADDSAAAAARLRAALDMSTAVPRYPFRSLQAGGAKPTISPPHMDQFAPFPVSNTALPNQQPLSSQSNGEI